ncbi:secreted frizzled-related protein 3-like [Babylonia areolata]|uniref:secreted frizzled-related protein 3-like n=1 Tax=Babylonia areolata TaxID=304850 RepID=UPI003FD40DEA
MIGSSSAFELHRLDTCEPIGIPRCRAMPYNMTRMPNLLHHSTQENARLAFDQFHVLLDRNCSEVLLFLLCAMYAPICTVAFQPEPIPPCRGVCERARAGCEPLMNAYNASWPEALSCSRLPRYERGVCVSPEAIVTPSSTPGKRCKCKKRKKRVKKMFRKHKYDYAIRAVIIRRKRVDAKTMTVKVQVEEVLFCSQVKFPRSNHVTLWTNSSCGCPKLRAGRHYLLMGHESVSKGRFLLSPNTALAVKWRDKWGARVKTWHQRLQKKKKKQQGQKKPDGNVPTTSAASSGRKARKRGKKRKQYKRNRNPKQRTLERKTILSNRNLTR